MSEKSLKNAIYFLVLVTGLYLLTSLLGGSDQSALAGQSGLEEVLVRLDPATISSVEIVGPRDTIRLQKEAERWSVNGFPADSAAIARFWQAVEDVELGAVTATNPANHARLGIDADSAWTVTFGQGETPILLGKSGTQFRTAYARLPGEDAVHLVRGDLRASATRSLTDWRDKIVFRTDTAAVGRVEVVRDGQLAAFERQDSTWSLNGSEADAATVRSLLQELAGFAATGFAADSAEMKADPDRSITVFDREGLEVGSVSLDDGDGNSRAKSTMSPYIFEVPTFRADRIAPAAGENEGD